MRPEISKTPYTAKDADSTQLRHVFETIGGESRDQVAVDHIMGHADQSMAAHYRERISDERLQKRRGLCT